MLYAGTDFSVFDQHQNSQWRWSSKDTHILTHSRPRLMRDAVSGT